MILVVRQGESGGRPHNTLHSVSASVYLTQWVSSQCHHGHPPQAVVRRPWWHNVPICPSNQPGSMRLTCVCVCVCVSHLPFQPGKQHETDLSPLRIMVPPCASEQGDEIDLCALLCVCECVYMTNIWQHKIYLPTHTCKWFTACTAHFWIHTLMSLCFNEHVVKFIGTKSEKMSLFQFTFMFNSVCVCIC